MGVNSYEKSIGKIATYSNGRIRWAKMIKTTDIEKLYSYLSKRRKSIKAA